MKLTITLFLIILQTLALGQSSNNSSPTLQLEDIQGKWFINLSNFPMWLKGNKTNPEFNYTTVERKGKTALLDEVYSEKKGKQSSITGYDTPLNAENTKFVWRGKGILGILKSKWEIVHFDQSEKWMVIYFEKTLFTPEGYDVVSREKNLSPAILKQVNQVLQGIAPKPELTVIPQN